ncbi:MAG TPA: anti-sigma factor [Dehalococcoidia bacterium]|nr:anti-sigma factor [Dehalococcoidia bacterium]
MRCDELREDLEAYALGILEPDRAHQVDTHLGICDECAAIVRDYQHALNHLALTVPLYRASPRLKQRIMGGAAGFRPSAIPATLRRTWVMSAAAVVVVGLAVGAIMWATALSLEVSRLKERNANLEAMSSLDAEQRAAILRVQSELNSARNEQQQMSTTLDEYANLVKVALDPDLIPTELKGTEPLASANASCSYVWSTKQSLGALTCKNLPSTAMTLTYELWATKGQSTLALGSFEPRIDGSASLLVTIPNWAPGPVTSLWVTLEQVNSNRDKPSSQVVLQPIPSQQAQR